MQGRENKEWSLLTHDVHTTFFQLLNYGLYWRIVAGDHQGFPIANRYRNQIFILGPASPTASNVNWTTIHGHEKFLICELSEGWKTDQKCAAATELIGRWDSECQTNYTDRGATTNLSQARPNILPQISLTDCFLKERIETQNLGKAQSLGALPAVAPLVWCALSAVVRVFYFFRAVPEMM